VGVDPRKLRSTVQLQVERSDIEFYNVAPDRVRIEVTVRNPSDQVSEPAFMNLQFADFGAFLPWHPLQRLRVPAIVPWGRTTVSTEVGQDRLEAIAEGPRRPAGRSMIATSAEEPQPPHAKAEARRSLLERLAANRQAWQIAMRLRKGARRSLVGRSTHWIGNINVFVGKAPVERHLARALRIHPGMTNMAIFSVGTRTDDYWFECSGRPLEGHSVLHLPCSGLPPFRPMDLARHSIQPGTWVTLPAYSHVCLTMKLPADCVGGELAVHVRRRSDLKEAVVEFSMDRAAAGPGCYVV
jgi:hypothetical protein